MNNEYREKIASEFRDTCNRTLERVANRDGGHQPFHEALLTDDIKKFSAFERSFSTSFGQRAIEVISEYVVLSNGADEAKRQKETIVSLSESVLAGIDEHDRLLRAGSLTPREKLFDYAFVNLPGANPADNKVSVRVISDLWWRKDDVNHYVSIKTVKPNIDQTAQAKRDMLTLKAGDETARTYFGLYYNPFGEARSSYSHNPPFSVFDMINDPVVLIGKDYWDTLGGDGCYEELLEIAQKVGIETHRRLSLL